MAIRIAPFAIPAIAVAGLVLLLNGLDASAGISVVAFGLVAVATGTAEFRAEYERLAPYKKLARIVIMRRASLGLTQAELASRMGTTASAISRIESGQHVTNAQILKKLGDAFGGVPRDSRSEVGNRVT
jgi:DNA-binding XRE family transcriptional regulator